MCLARSYEGSRTRVLISAKQDGASELSVYVPDSMKNPLEIDSLPATVSSQRLAPTKACPAFNDLLTFAPRSLVPYFTENYAFSPPAARSPGSPLPRVLARAYATRLADARGYRKFE